MAPQVPAIPSQGLQSADRSFFPDLNPLDRFRVAIAEELSRISHIDKSLALSGLDRTTNLDNGDLVLVVPRLRMKGVAPAELAKKIVAEFESHEGAKVKAPIADGISIKFFFTPTELTSTLVPLILQQQEAYGFNPNLGLRDPLNPDSGQKTVIVEFSSPNIAKKFHAGHLRSTIIGGFLSNLYERSGYKVVRMNYLGDWGRQYGLLACGWKRYGDEDAFAKDPIGHLFDIYVKISADFQPEEDEFKAAGKRGEDTSELESRGLLGEAKAYFKRMEDGDEEALQLWRRFRDLSIERYNETYARLNIRFTDYSGESQVKQETMKKAEEILRERGVLESDEGASIVDFKKHGAKKLGVAVVRNRNGTSNYLLRDVGAAIQREDTYHFDELLYVVMSEQETHLNRLFKILDLMGEGYATLSKRMKHITFGKVMGMSTRKGNVKFLDDILADVGDFMHDVMRRNETKYSQVEDPTRTAELLGLSAIMVQDMSGKRINNYEFSLERMTSFEGDTGPYLQYAHARLSSIFRKVDITRDEMLGADFSLLAQSPHAISMLRAMARFPDMVHQAQKTLEPTTILMYLFKLTHELSSSYDHLRVVNPPEGRAVSIARAALYQAARQVLHNGMVLLGLRPLDRM
ncbi:arginyl-tRNA synthetase [Durotheca rogersii]|uniref:arginyl-tRNA synthetase n=1 Tax=Durotheca rogersii TaxID=419775 RepID=UPI00221F1C00|nr:arginyl-tRNA synthetase [Durotheca rogersii]KAI5867302.1 arginyl-tRNA synthetase [Durotheca rogersii]